MGLESRPLWMVLISPWIREIMGLVLHIPEKLQYDSAAATGRNYHC